MSSLPNNIKPICGWSDRYSKIHFVYRGEDGKKKEYTITDFKWYFFMAEKDFNRKEISEIIDNATNRNIILETEKTNGFVKITCVGDRKMPIVSSLIEDLDFRDVDLRESDLDLTKRYMIDHKVEIEDELTYLFFDIETDDREAGITIGGSPILSWAACDNNGKVFFQRTEDVDDKQAEINLIKDLVRLFIKYDLVVSWNGKQFDMPYIEKRIEELDIQTKTKVLLHWSPLWKHFIQVDLMQRCISLFGATMTTLGLTGFSLNEVARLSLKEEKENINDEKGFYNSYKNSPEQFKKYNIQDAVLLYKLNEKLSILPLMLKECVWTGTFMNRFYISELLDNYILREAHKKGYFLKKRPDYHVAKEAPIVKIRGGYVMNPKVGLYKNVRIFDFASLYPTMIVSWNIGNESLVEDISEEALNNFKEWLGERKLEEVNSKLDILYGMFIPEDFKVYSLGLEIEDTLGDIIDYIEGLI